MTDDQKLPEATTDRPDGWATVPPMPPAGAPAHTATGPTGGWHGAGAGGGGWAAGPPDGAAPAGAPVPAGDGAGPSRRGRRRFGAAALALAVAAGGAGGGLVSALVSTGSTATAARVTATVSPTAATTSEPTAAAVIAAVEPALVNIIATGTSSVESAFGTSGSTTTEAAGTGMIISSDGLVLTNAHVIAGATTIDVIENGTTRQLPATLVGEDAAKDVALIKITGATGLPTVTLGSDNGVVSGDAVLAIGNALNLKTGAFSASSGIISGLDRSISTDNDENLTGLLQTDAAISSGDSGGPLVNQAGDVIGMDTATASSSGSDTAQNIGFAIPVSEIESLLPTLEHGSIGTETFGTSSAASTPTGGGYSQLFGGGY